MAFSARKLYFFRFSAKVLRVIITGGIAVCFLLPFRFHHTLLDGNAPPPPPRDRGGMDATAEGMHPRRTGGIKTASFPVSAKSSFVNGPPSIHFEKNGTLVRAGQDLEKVSSKRDSGGDRAGVVADEQMELMKKWMDKVNDENASADELLLRWLRRHRNETSKNVTGPHQLLSSPFNFVPGTLPLSRAATLRRCYTDPIVYEKHMKYPGTRRKASHSAERRVAYVMLPKSGSSTARRVMERGLGAGESVVDVAPPLRAFTFVRDPLTRFYSQYDEAFLRTAPWNRIKNRYYVDPSTGRSEAAHPSPFLYDRMRSYKDYEDAFCPDRKSCDSARTQENGTLASRFERFVHEWDGLVPHDVHLSLQTPLLSTMTGYSLHMDRLYDSADPERGWEDMAKEYFSGEEEEAFERKFRDVIGRGVRLMSRPRRFNVSLVGEGAKRRICELTLLDYCCLNFPLPEVCTGVGRAPGRGGDAVGSDRLMCKMDYDERHGRIRVQPGAFPGM